MQESGQPVLYLASSPLLSLRKGGVVMLLHNAVVVPAFVSCFFLGIDTGGSIAAAAMSMLLCPHGQGLHMLHIEMVGQAMRLITLAPRCACPWG